MTVHIIGAGLAGLSAAVALTQQGVAVTLWESTPQAGGRTRSFLDPALGLVIDNGNHLALSGNWGLRRYLDMISAVDRMETLRPAAIPFVDLASGQRWSLRPGLTSLFRPGTLPPGVSALGVVRDLTRLALSGRHTTVVQALGPANTPAFRRLWAPLAVSILNTAPERASARILWSVIRETLARGEAACRPMLPGKSLDDALIAPALTTLRAGGADIRFTARIRNLTLDGGRVIGLETAAGLIALAPTDRVILATPPEAARALLPQFLPQLATPPSGGTILNIHYSPSTSAASAPRLLGVVGGRIEWVFRHENRLSVTISDAGALANQPALSLGAALWPEVAAAQGIPDSAHTLPPFRVIKERRATFDATPDARHRPKGPLTALTNLFVAGDWTQNPLPSTMEAAVRSGLKAAEVVSRRG